MARPYVGGKRGKRVALLCALWGGMLLLLSGCSPYPQTTFDPRSDVATSIQNLFMTTVWWGLIVVVPVEFALLFTVLRFRRRSNQAPGPPVGRHGSTRLEITWTIVPVLVLVAIAIPTVQVIFNTEAAASPSALQIHVTAHQWWWEIRYPRLHVVTANELHLPVGQTANFTLDSADVIHSFWIPAFDGKRDVLPNHENNLWFTPHVTGTFPGQCAEFCGPSHAYMKLTTVVQSQAAFDAWVRQQQKAQVVPAAITGPALVRAGAAVFASHSCAGCHTIAGTGASGQVGPNLTHVGSRHAIGIQQDLPNTPANLTRWITNSSAFKPGSYMPPQNLSKSDMTALVAYLESLK